MNISQLLRHPHKSRGNTIIEVMIAMLIIGTVMTALAITMTYSVKNTSEAQYRDIATTLASEPIEVLRYIRSTSNWQTFYNEMPAGTRCISNAVYSVGDVGTIANSFVNPILSGDCAAVSVQSGSASINFSRKVTITKTNTNTNEISVISEVTWSRNDAKKSDVTLEQVFHNTSPR